MYAHIHTHKWKSDRQTGTDTKIHTYTHTYTYMYMYMQTYKTHYYHDYNILTCIANNLKSRTTGNKTGRPL